MTMKPILFNTEMVLANLDGRKNNTRRLMKGYALDHLQIDTDGSVIGVYDQHEGRVRPVTDYAPYQLGDILYVRETWRVLHASYPPRRCTIEYRAGGTKEFNEIIALPTAKGEWKPSIHMPKKAARIFLRVKNVRVERLQDIDDNGVVAEGLHIGDPFDELWDSTIKKADRDRYGWDANPWVWVILYERCEKPEV